KNGGRAMSLIADFFRVAWPTIVAIVGAGPIVWFATEFLARPIKHFFDLRQEAKVLTLLLWNAPQYGGQSSEDWREQMDTLKEPRDRLTSLAAKMFAFAQSETFAAWSVRILRYDPVAASRAINRLVFELGTDIEDRDRNYRKVDLALKFPFDPKRPFYDPYHPER